MGSGETAPTMTSVHAALIARMGPPPVAAVLLDTPFGFQENADDIPHYNTAEGGTHDTRYCYMGERRLRMLEEMLPDDVSVLGVDEHTACIFDLDAGEMAIRGRGAVTWRHRGASRRVESGTVM